jgi:DHA2 family multidrug resistance protein
MLARRSQYHQEILINYTTPGNPNFQNSVSGLAQHLARSGLGAQEAHQQAYARIYQFVQVQAATLAYVDTFKVLAVASAIMFLLAFTLKRNEPGGGADLAVG